ncbi:MAG: low molecular weight protein-tyrosine-phosphatase [Sedimenticola sp.]
MNNIRVLIVCTANICRSPMAEAMLKSRLKLLDLDKFIFVDSAGTHATSKGKDPDPRSRQVLLNNKVDIRSSGSRLLNKEDFEVSDYILVMDRNNYDHLISRCPEHHRNKISYIMKYAESPDSLEVPDPYFGNISGFNRVFDMLDQALGGFLIALRDRI